MARKLLIALSLGSTLASPATAVYADENGPKEGDRASGLSVSERISAKYMPAAAHTGSTVPQLPEFFPGFTLDGDQSLIALARFYGLRVPGLARGLSIGEYLIRACNGTPCPGDRLRLSHAELWVVETTDNLVTKVGLRPLTGL
jgi:NhaP-type Na+/H+ and K+/H+ antiporter